MRVRLLGTHQGESRDTRFISMLVDENLVIDAGGLTSSLTLEEQGQIDAVLITHRHYDHIKDLPPLAHNLWESKSLLIYCLDDTRQALQAHIFNDVVWPSMQHLSEGYHPLVFHQVKPGEAFEALGYRILPVEMNHTVPTVGYLVERGGRSLFYTADTNDAGNPSWTGIRPDLLIIETTMRSEDDATAARFKHLTPLSLEIELQAFYSKQRYYPSTICVHINPKHEAQIKEELAALSQRLGAEITAGREGMVVDV